MRVPTQNRSSRARRCAPPRDAATLIVVDSSSGEPRVLLGRRRLDMVFMPGRYVFPGGRVDPRDRQSRWRTTSEPRQSQEPAGGDEGPPKRVAGPGAGSGSRTRDLRGGGPADRQARADGRSSQSQAWQEFFAHGFRPALDRLTFFARAITPPGRPRRFDTRFFCVPADAIGHKIAIADGELSDLEWHSIAQARSLELPNITRVVLEDLGERIAAGALHKARFAGTVLSPANRQFPPRPDQPGLPTLTNQARGYCAAGNRIDTRVTEPGPVWQNRLRRKSSCSAPRAQGSSM